MKTLVLFLTLMATASFGQLPTFTDANVKTYFDTASVATIDTFAVHASQNYKNAWQSRFNFMGKQIFLTDLSLVIPCDSVAFIKVLAAESFSKANPSLRGNVPIDHTGFNFVSDGDNSGTISKIDTKIHTDWVWMSVPPYVILASFWITKDIKK